MGEHGCYARVWRWLVEHCVGWWEWKLKRRKWGKVDHLALGMEMNDLLMLETTLSNDVMCNAQMREKKCYRYRPVIFSSTWCEGRGLHARLDAHFPIEFASCCGTAQTLALTTRRDICHICISHIGVKTFGTMVLVCRRRAIDRVDALTSMKHWIVGGGRSAM